jgi:GNAT superfamily N-acetyltransferase
MTDHFTRMLQLAESFFDAKNDPDQLAVTDADRERLLQLHPATMSEERDGDGPVAWLLLIPTTLALMERFLALEIGERELLWETPLDGPCEAVYLCSALVLEEYRGKGIARRLTLEAIRAMQKDHHITTLFTWPFSSAGDRLSASIAQQLQLPLRVRPR